MPVFILFTKKLNPTTTSYDLIDKNRTPKTIKARARYNLSGNGSL